MFVINLLSVNAQKQVTFDKEIWPMHMIQFMASSKEPINPKDVECIKTMLKSGILQNTFPSMHDVKENPAAKTCYRPTHHLH